MNPRLKLRLVALALMLTGTSICAHHATAAQFDTSRMIEFTGVIEKINWANPHIHVYVTVTGERNREEHWDVEFPSPGGVIVAGLSRELLKPGTTLTVKGYPSRTPENPGACAAHVTLSNGLSTSFTVGI